MIADTNEKAGNGNSGRDLSGDIISPHLLGLGIFNGESRIISFGQE